MRQYSLLILILLDAGCSKRATPPAAAMTPNSLQSVQKIISTQLSVPADTIRPDSTFAALGADDLDLVEIVMATEDDLGLSISDESLNLASQAPSAEKLAGSLTVRVFAAVVDSSPKSLPPKSSNEPNDGGLYATQVGPFGELSKLPNPRGHKLVFVPSFEDILAHAEATEGRELTETEKVTLKTKSAVIAMSPEDADKLTRKRLERTNQ